MADQESRALERSEKEAYDCLVLDLRLPDMTGFEVLELALRYWAWWEIFHRSFYRKGTLAPEEDARFHMLARSVVVKGVESPERLFDETASLSSSHRNRSSSRTSRRCSIGCIASMKNSSEEEGAGRGRRCA